VRGRLPGRRRAMKRHADAACGFPDEIARPARTFAFDQESEGERNANGARNLETGTLSGKIAYRAIDHRSIVEQYLGASQDAIATYRSTFAHRLRLPDIRDISRTAPTLSSRSWNRSRTSGAEGKVYDHVINAALPRIGQF